jgi:hypothetical protein
VSGWIKIEKDLETDPRIRRIARALCNADASRGVTQVVGGLTRLWMHADSHVRADDTLDMSTSEIDEWLGLPGFCALLPEDWLTPLDDSSVELPGFQTHNGVDAKKRALTQKRTTRYRHNMKRKSVTLASPDQTRPRPDKTKTRAEGDARGKPPRATRSPAAHLPGDFELTPERRAIAIAEHLDPDRTFAKFKNHWNAAAGAKARKRDWQAAWAKWCLTEADHHRGNGNANGAGHTPRKTRFEELTDHLRHGDET